MTALTDPMHFNGSFILAAVRHHTGKGSGESRNPGVGNPLIIDPIAGACPANRVISGDAAVASGLAYYTGETSRETHYLTEEKVTVNFTEPVSGLHLLKIEPIRSRQRTDVEVNQTQRFRFSTVPGMDSFQVSPKPAELCGENEVPLQSMLEWLGSPEILETSMLEMRPPLSEEDAQGSASSGKSTDSQEDTTQEVGEGQTNTQV